MSKGGEPDMRAKRERKGANSHDGPAEVRRRGGTAGDTSARRWARVGLRGVSALALVALVLLSATALYGFRTMAGAPALCVIALDGTWSDVDRLIECGAVDSQSFRVWARLTGFHARKGPHLLAAGLTPWELSARVAGHGKTVRVIIPEGLNRFEIGRRLESTGVTTKAAFVEASSDATLLHELGIIADSAEGYLFPATYELPLDADPSAIVRRQKQEFDKRYQGLLEKHQAGVSQLGQTLGWELHQIVILASMVEKEAAVEKDRPLIASVFVNRLRDRGFVKKLLQCDPTSAYGCVRAQEGVGKAPAHCARFHGKVTREIHQDPTNLYSGYVHEGLPPGPIANPGVASLRAVMDLPATRYLYFYAKPGLLAHTFSETYEAHQAAIREGGP